jgi:hypothetical protein
MAGEEPRQEVEPNNTPAQAQEVPSTCGVAATAEDWDHDQFRIPIEAPSFLEVRVSAAEGFDCTVNLIDSRRRLVGTANGGGPCQPEEMVCRVRRDTYLLHLSWRRARDCEAAEGRYRVRIREFDPASYEPSIAEIKAAIKQGLVYLASQQQPEGWWEPQPLRHGISGLVLMGLAAEGLPDLAETAEKCAEFYKRSYIAPDSFKDTPHLEARLAGSLVGRRPPHFLYEQAIAVLAMSEYVHHRQDEAARPLVAEGVRLLLRSQNTTAKPKLLRGPVGQDKAVFGGWKYTPEDTRGDLSASGWCLIALAGAKAAGFDVPDGVQKHYMVFCRKCFNEEAGAYGYQPTGRGRVTNTLNAIGVLTTLLCVGSQCEFVRPGLRRIRRYFPSWEQEGAGGGYPFYYWYYASRAMFVAGGDYWTQWRGVVCPMLLRHQNADGSWDAADSEEKLGRNYSTAMAVLILQLCSGNPPAYLKGLGIQFERYPCSTCVDDIEDLLRKAARDRRSKEQVIEDIQKLINRYRGE